MELTSDLDDTALLSILMLFLWLPCKASIIWLLTNSQVWARVPGRETDFSS